VVLVAKVAKAWPDKLTTCQQSVALSGGERSCSLVRLAMLRLRSLICTGWFLPDVRARGETSTHIHSAARLILVAASSGSHRARAFGGPVLYRASSHLPSGMVARRCPTKLAQYSTSSRSSSLKAARKWLSISSSPTTFPRTKMGTTISDLVSCEHAR
jgi:hypothetical protein